MKRIFSIIFIISVFMTSAKAETTDYWTISLNKQVLFKGNVDAQNPSVSIKKSTAKKAKGSLVIQYNMDAGSPDWNRTFYINDSKENSYKTVKIEKQSGSVEIPISVLQKMLAKNEPVYIYTMSLPKDANIAATVRVRRMLLCKIEWS